MAESILSVFLRGAKFAALSLTILVGQSLPVQAGSATIDIPQPNPLGGHWSVFHNAAVGECGGVGIPMPSEGPDSVDVTVKDKGREIVATAPGGAVTMQRIDRAVWKKRFDGDMTILQRLKPKDPYLAMLADVVGDKGLVYAGDVVVSGHRMNYVIGWFRSKPDTILGHLSMNDQTCHVVRGFEARR